MKPILRSLQYIRSLPTAVTLALLIGTGSLAGGHFASAADVDLAPAEVDSAPTAMLELEKGQRLGLIGNSTAANMGRFGQFEALMHSRMPEKQVRFRNFGWPADAVSIRQRPGNYTKIDDPFLVFGPNLLISFFGMNESYDGTEPATIEKFIRDYQAMIQSVSKSIGGRDAVRWVLVSPIAFEPTGDPIEPDGVEENRRLAVYRDAVKRVAELEQVPFVDLFSETYQAFTKQPGAQFTTNGIHVNKEGDELVGNLLDHALFGPRPDVAPEVLHRLREVVVDKSWLHRQDYRMLNGWYVYGGRRTWDTETFPGEYQKIREMVAVRDRYLWDLAAGMPVPAEPDDSSTREVFIPETMFGSRDDNFRKMREPKTLEYPTPEESIKQMTLPEGFEVQCFASEKDFPELANPTQIAFDNKNRLWVSCMVNYPQWLPGKSRPDDRLLIFEDTDGDGVADKCKTFYDKLICPTGFEFYKDGVVVVDEPSILFLRDTDGDDVADEVTQLVDGIGTDDTHHAMGAWEYSPGGLLHMLEGIAMSTTLETPWGPKRHAGASGAYVWDLESRKMRHFRTPGQANPWCFTFDGRGNGVVGDGTNANQHWSNLFSGAEVKTRSSIDAIFNNEGIRPAAGNEFLTTRQFPVDYHDRLTYACVINLHGMPTFRVQDIDGQSGLGGKRLDNLIESTDMFFRPVDPKIGPDGTLWFGDWCNALIGHMQYSQRDPNRDHKHGRIYRLVYKDLPLVQNPVPAELSVEELLDQLTVFEARTRYRIRRELRRRGRDAVLPATAAWAAASDDPDVWREALWVQEHFHSIDPGLVKRVLADAPRDHRAAAIHSVGNQSDYLENPVGLLAIAATDNDPRVRLEVVRAASFIPTFDSFKTVMSVTDLPRDTWIDYVLRHTIMALEPVWKTKDLGELMAALSPSQQEYLQSFRGSLGPGAQVYAPLKVLTNVDAGEPEKQLALQKVVAAAKGDRGKGKAVFKRVCASCHQHGDLGKKFGPQLTGLGDRMTKAEIVASIVWPNESISKGYETEAIMDIDGVSTSGFILAEDDESVTLGIADGKEKRILKDDIDLRKPMKASSMPEGLTETIAPSEFVDLIAFLMDDWVATNPNLDYKLQSHDGWPEVSRQSHVLLGKDYPAQYNAEAEHLLSHEGVRKVSFAIHSANRDSTDHDLIIRMNDPTEVRFVKIFNRRDATFHHRAKGLTMWISDDAKRWKQVWSSDEAYPDWSFTLPEGTQFRYAKFGLRRPGILHLDRITMYGNVLETP
ncbi:MAG: PVC-type heme-binding CxxCH protein [Planctomycetota bacterium]